MGMGKYQKAIWLLCGFGYFVDLMWAQVRAALLLTYRSCCTEQSTAPAFRLIRVSDCSLPLYTRSLVFLPDDRELFSVPCRPD
jgi:hypothetical protein